MDLGLKEEPSDHVKAVLQKARTPDSEGWWLCVRELKPGLIPQLHWVEI